MNMGWILFPFASEGSVCPEEEAPEEIQVTSLGTASRFWIDNAGEMGLGRHDRGNPGDRGVNMHLCGGRSILYSQKFICFL